MQVGNFDVIYIEAFDQMQHTDDKLVSNASNPTNVNLVP
jgi:hypothetical protein